MVFVSEKREREIDEEREWETKLSVHFKIRLKKVNLLQIIRKKLLKKLQKCNLRKDRESKKLPLKSKNIIKYISAKKEMKLKSNSDKI